MSAFIPSLLDIIPEFGESFLDKEMLILLDYGCFYKVTMSYSDIFMIISKLTTINDLKLYFILNIISTESSKNQENEYWYFL